MTPTYAFATDPSISSGVIDTLTTIAQWPETCRAEVSSMPEGPAGGRIEAKRRALTTPSPAPASSARWCDEPICTPTARVSRRTNVCCARPDFWRSIDSFCSAKSGHEYMHTCGALIRHRSVRSDMDLRHGHRWRERPRLGGLGSLVGQDSGVVHAIVRAATPTPAPALTAAQSAASRARSHEVAARAVVAGSSPSYAHQG